MQPPTTTVGIADDHALFLASLKTILQKDGEFVISVEAKNGKSYLENSTKLGLPDISILDVNMPLLNGIDTLKCIKIMSPKSKVILMTGYSDWVTHQELQTVGAHSVILKNAEPDEFLSTIKFVQDLPMPDDDNRALKKRPNLHNSIELNQKELQFAKLLSTGICYADIAKEMHLSIYRIHDYRNRLFELFETKSQASLVVKLIGGNFANGNISR